MHISWVDKLFNKQDLTMKKWVIRLLVM